MGWIKTGMITGASPYGQGHVVHPPPAPPPGVHQGGAPLPPGPAFMHFPTPGPAGPKVTPFGLLVLGALALMALSVHAAREQVY